MYAKSRERLWTYRRERVGFIAKQHHPLASPSDFTRLLSLPPFPLYDDC